MNDEPISARMQPRTNVSGAPDDARDDAESVARKPRAPIGPISGTAEPYNPQQPQIANRCPACGGRTLFIGAGGWLTCSRLDCKHPAFSDALEAREAEAKSALEAARTDAREAREEAERLKSGYEGLSDKWSTEVCKLSGQVLALLLAREREKER